MKNKEKMFPILVAVVTFIVVIAIFLIINANKKDKYSCYDSTNDITYTFETEEEMHEVCDNLNSEVEEELDKEDEFASYPIYNDLVNAEDPSFAFYPYINDDNKLSIIVAIADCDNVELAKSKARKWFSDHSYNISDYTIEYENPCITE